MAKQQGDLTVQQPDPGLLVGLPQNGEPLGYSSQFLEGMLASLGDQSSSADLERMTKVLSLRRQIREELERVKKEENEQSFFRTVANGERVRLERVRQAQEHCTHVHPGPGRESQVAGQKMHDGSWWLQCSMCQREFKGTPQEIFAQLGHQAMPDLSLMGSAA